MKTTFVTGLAPPGRTPAADDEPGLRPPVHGVHLAEVTPQGPPRPQLYPAHRLCALLRHLGQRRVARGLPPLLRIPQVSFADL